MKGSDKEMLMNDEGGEDFNQVVGEDDGVIYVKCTKSYGCVLPMKHTGRCKNYEGEPFNKYIRCLKTKGCVHPSPHQGPCTLGVEAVAEKVPVSISLVIRILRLQNVLLAVLPGLG